MTPARSRVDAAATLLVAAGALAYLLPLRHYGVAISDDGWYLHPVLRMREGAVLYRDVWTFYAPLEHHLFAALFSWTGPSIEAARVLLATCIAAAAAMTYRLARRAAPPVLAWLPAAVYALVPGPWPKAFLGLCTAAFFLALARALERPGAARFALTGIVAGATLGTRQDLGVAQLAITLVAAVLPGLVPRAFEAPVGRSVARAAGLLAAALAGFAAVVAPIAAWYAAQGALGDLVDAVFLLAARQTGAFPPPLPALLALRAAEGTAVATLILLPVILYAGWAFVLLQRLAREGIRRRSVLEGALLAYAVATYHQAIHPILLVRLLQSALPCWVLATWAVAAARDAARTPRARAAIVAAATAGAAALVAFVLVGVERVHPSDLYTGSARVRSFDAPLEVLGDTLFVGWAQAEEVRLVRAFYATHTEPGEPTAALPAHPLYWILVDRPNPMRFVADHAHGNFIMTAEQKQAEAERLLASGARTVVAEQAWYAGDEVHDPLRQLLVEEYRPVRSYVSVAVFERDGSADGRALGAILRRTQRGEATAADLDTVRDLAQRAPDEPLPWKLLGALAGGAGAVDEAVAAYRHAAAVDPQDVSALERSAELLLAAGRPADARLDVARARAVRESPTLRALARRLAGERIEP